MITRRQERAIQRWKEEKEERLVRKQTRSSRGNEKVRPKDWLPAAEGDPDAFADLDIASEERVMPRGERERRRANLDAARRLATLETGEAARREPESSQQRQGVVTEVSAGLCRVDLGGQDLLCSLRGSLAGGEIDSESAPVAAGDDVLVTEVGSGRAVVEAVLPRRSVLVRPDVARAAMQHVIAANVDQVLIVASWREPAFWPELLDRYLIAAERNRLSPIICINKIDLADGAAAYQSTLRPYRALGYPVIFASTVSGAGIEDVRRTLCGRTTAVAGLSGVGKSSLLGAAQPGLNLRTGEVSERRHEGQHTTTQAVLLRLEGGGFVVDTPGIREFGLSGLTRRELPAFYPEITLAADHCRFDDCLHLDEPGCAVRAAVGAGWIAAMRYDSYKKIGESLEK